MNKLNNNYDSDDTDEYDTDSDLSYKNLEYDILLPSEINAKNCLTISNRNNRLKNKIKKYLNKNIDILNENILLKQKINILLDRNYKLIDLNNQIINNYENNIKIYKYFSSFLTTGIIGLCYFYYKKIKLIH
jgi:hypothetical protein